MRGLAVVFLGLALAAPALGAGNPVAGKAVFKSTCGSCHTLKAAGATATVGPDLDKLKQYAAQANRGPIAAFVKQSIVSPGAYLQPGYQNLMPPTFGTQIPPAQLDQLVQYLVSNAK